jgi:hypothetical protein
MMPMGSFTPGEIAALVIGGILALAGAITTLLSAGEK